MLELNLGQPPCYKLAYQTHQSNNLVITFTPTNGFFLYHNNLNSHKICISTTQPNYYIFNPGNACKKIASYIQKIRVKHIILIGSSKAGLASLVWGDLLQRALPDGYHIYSLSFSPQTLLYPFNDRLYFPSYDILKKNIRNNAGMLKCAENYGDVNKVLAGSKLEGMIIYPRLNPCDKAEAERIQTKNIKLVGLDYPLHGSFLPFMKQVKDKQKLQEMVKKIFQNAQIDQDITATIPSTETELLNIITSINMPTIEELCQAIFFKMRFNDELNNFKYVHELGLV